ncbi:rod shape-determining protein [Thermomonospora umbrina]|uniref:Rod shape-determining protein MreB n=1 Tax=Thermomonospora umbrina TaxID=111806 RepID=A0A3D9SM02_9ACTN|nr:rod shape-determining protein [Thermomonospora umbrina]REE96757.1 rod shape-determining protein MreB [Thermomonospora umbrina]
MQLRDFPCRDTAVDLGSRTARVHVRGRGVVASTPSVLAICARTGRCLAAGEQALAMRDQSPPDVRFTWPFEGGVPAEDDSARTMLQHLIHVGHSRRYMTNPRIAVAVPCQITDVQQRALADALDAAGARQVALVPTPLAAALGTGLPVDRPQAVMVIDVGAVVTDIAVMSMGAVVSARTVRLGGQDLDRAIIEHVRRTRGVLLGAECAAEAKSRIAAGGHRDQGVLVYGRDDADGLPRRVLLGAGDIGTAIAAPLEAVFDGIQATLQGCTPEMVRDLSHGPITLTGGGARFPSLPALIRAQTGLHARVADNARDAVVLGTAMFLDRTPVMLRRRPRTRDRHRGFLTGARHL